MTLLGRDTWVKGPFPGRVEVLLETFRGEEALGRPYRYGVGLLSHDPLLDANDVLGKPLAALAQVIATLRLLRGLESLDTVTIPRRWL